jgi:hypothetical protein
MVTVSTRPNHYEVLGLNPTASDAEIARAFARQMGMFRPIADAAHIGVAYEVLRDPAKRRAYDDALGLRPQPQPVHSPTAISFRTSVRPIGLAPANGVERRAETLSEPPPQVHPEPRSEVSPEPGPGSFIAASLREPAEPEPSRVPLRLAPGPEPEQAEAERILKSKIGDLVAGERAREDRSNDEDRPIGWGRTGVAVGALVVGVALIGAWVGMDSGDAETQQPAERAVSVALPAPKPLATVTQATPNSGAIEYRPQRTAPVFVAEHRTTSPKSQRRSSASEDRLADVSKSLASGYYAGAPADSTTAQPEPAVADAPAVATTAAATSMPLPNRVIAQTIHRIGYACGEVASTSAGDSPGVYNVTCTSGHSYQAKPVRGRYRFRRLASH